MLSIPMTGAPAFAAPTDDDGDVAISVSKYIDSPQEGTVTFEPGEQFSYTIEVSCSVLGTAPGCVDARVQDLVPPPLVLQSASISAPGNTSRNDSVVAENQVDMVFTSALLGGQVGMVDGTTAIITVNVMIPSDITWEEAQGLGEIVNTADFTATGERALAADDSATIVIDVPEQLAADAVKTADDNMGDSGRPIPAVPGKPVDFAIGGGNTSNRPVDTITITDPAAGSTNLEYLDFTTIGPITPPAGADQFYFTYTDADGTHRTGPFPAPTDSFVPEGVDLTTVTSVSFEFSNSTGSQLPPAADTDDYASIGVGAVTNDAVTDLPVNTPIVVHNVTETTVGVDDRTASDTASDDVTIMNVPPGVDVTKSFDRNRLLPNESTVATLRADNGGKDVVQMTIADPQAGQPGLHDQGLIFGGFTGDVEWPREATGATVTYTYADGTSETLPSTGEWTELDTLPESSHPEDVVGFEVVFTGPIDAGAYAVLPFDVTGIPVEGDAEVTTTNTVNSTVTDSDGATVSADNRADITRVPLRVYTDVEKNIIRDEIYSVPGATTTVTLEGQVRPADAPENPSTVGAEYLIVRDPADPEAGSDFWNHFDVTAIGPVAVPQNAVMTVEYWDVDAQQWRVLPVDPMPVPPGTTWSYTVPEELQDSIGGLQFTFEPAEEGELLQPGFNVDVPFRSELRDQLRDGSGPASGGDETVTVGNDAQSIVENDDTGQGPVTDEAEDAIDLLPIDGGEGPDLVDKTWVESPVLALSGASTTATLRWGTLGIPMETMTVTDPMDAETLDIEDSVFDAFDLASIGAITEANDPGIRFDQVYAQRLSAETGAWVDVSSCTAASPCRGSFPAYTLGEDERTDTVGIRFVYSERPDRADVITNVTTDPAVGSGVAETNGRDRQIPLGFGLRDYLRSDPDMPVLGEPYGYNTGVAGLVRNTVHALGVSGDDEYDSSDFAEMEIVDSPLNVTLDKRFVDYDENAADPYTDSEDVTAVGLPQEGTPQEDFPIVTALLRATNQSNTRVSTMTITDPDPLIAEDILNEFNLYRIADITVPEGAIPEASTVTLTWSDGTEWTYSIADAEDLGWEELQDAVGVEVFHTGRLNGDGSYGPMIADGASTTLRLEYQLREFLRSNPNERVTTTDGSPLVNHAIVDQTRPGVDENAQPAPEHIEDLAQDDLVIEDATYGVGTTKRIDPGTRSETQPREGYVVTMTGRPTGTVRTIELSLTDDTPTFWNAFEFAGFRNVVLPSPVQQVRVDVLTDVEYSGALVQTCEGDADLGACWSEGDWLTPASGGLVTAAQFDAALAGLGVGADEVQGLRFSYRRTDGSNWERPSNPIVTASFTADRRETLVYGAGGATDVEVPSTRPGLDPAPGETQAGHFTDTVVADAVGSWDLDENPWTATVSEVAETVLTHVTNGISVTKVHGRESASSNPNSFVPGAEIPYSITVTNTGGWDITGLVLTDQVETDASGPMLVEPERDVDDPTPIYTATLNGAALTPFSGAMDDDGLIEFDLPEDFVFHPTDTLVIHAALQFRQSPDPVAPGTFVTNGVTATSDRYFDTCDFTDQAVWQPQSTDVPECSSETEAQPVAMAPIATRKSVKGVGAGAADAEPGDPNYDDLGVLGAGLTAENAETYCSEPNAGDGYYRTPCVPITRPGGIEEWRLEFRNNGNIPLTKLVSIDVLPAPGDTGVILSGARQSRWQPVFTGSLDAMFNEEGGDVSVYYSTVVPNRACNEAEIQYETGGISSSLTSCTDEVVNQRPSMWLPYSDALAPEVKASIRALKLIGDFSAAPLLPNETAQVTFLTQTPWYSDRPEQPSSGADPVAWNSFASGSVGMNISTPVQSPVVEPRKVGVALATGQLELSKTVEGDDWDLEYPADYVFILSCTSGGEPVPLVGVNGEDMSHVRLAADGTVLSYNSGTGEWGNVNLPLYAECSIAEDSTDPSSQGTVVTYTPEGADSSSSGLVPALRFAFADNVVDPAETGDPEQATISALNTYLPGGFTVTKSVDNGGATDQDGADIVYDRMYSFEASCTFLDQETIPEADRVFTLTDGGSKTFSDLPAGAECLVTETDGGGAADTSVTISQDGGEPETVDEASFTVIAYDDAEEPTALTTVAFENVFTVGAVEITKQVTGPGGADWGAGPFVLEMSCTLDGVTPNPVWEGTTTLTSPDDLVWEVGGLPTGAECVVTETQSGGANSSTNEITLVVGDDPEQPATGTISNTFTLGSLVVQKELLGEPAASLDPATGFVYEVSLSCTRVVNDETVPVAIPLGPTRTITAGGQALYEGLPTGASCTLTESDPGHSTSHEFDPPGPYTIGDAQTPVEVTLTNEFANGAVSIEKTIDAPEGFPVPEAFTATVSCTWFGAEVPLVDGGVVTIVPGEAPVTIPDVPVGSVCTVAEDDFGQTGTTVLPESITVDEADETFAFEVENAYEWASLQVGKVVESESEFVPTQFAFSVVCTFQGETVVDETFTLDAGQLETITEIPARSECTVTETDDRGADGTVTEAEVVGAEGELAPVIDQETRTVVIPELQPDATVAVNTVTYTNLYDSTAMVLVKEFAGAGADQFGRTQTFTFSVTCVFAGETVMDVQVELNAENGWTSAITDVVAGSECTVVENDLNGADAVVIEPNDGENTSVGTGVVPEGGGLVTVTATNWYLTGSLEVTKTFAGDAAEKFGTDDFELTLSCLRDGVAVEIPDGALRTVSAESPTALWANLPTGSECTLAETDDGGANSTAILDAEGNVVAADGEGYTFTVETDAAILSVDDQPQPSLQVQNTFNFAQVAVTKSVASDAVDQEGQPIVYGPFEVELACVWNGQDVLAAEDMVQTIADGETVTWTELPEGAVCTITETDTSDASSTSIAVTQAGSEEAPITGTVVDLAPLPNTAAEDQTSVAIVNAYEVASLSIAKLLDGTAASTVTRTFTVAATCVFVDVSHPEPGQTVFDGEFEIGGPQRLTADIENLPAGTVCTVTETDDGDADSTTMTVDGVEQAGDSGTVTLTSGHVAIVFTNTFMAPLPPTGVALAWGIPALALLLLGGGAFAIMIARRRRPAGAEPPQ